MNVILETERLRLREFTLQDTAFILELLNSPGWLQFIGDRNVKTEQQATEYLENGPIKSYRENGYGLWLVKLQENQKAIGMCGIINRATLDHPDIGFAFLPEFTGSGYAFEIASATMAYAKDRLKLPEICAITVPDNTRSINLLTKIGLSYSHTTCLPNSDEELLLYSTR